MKTYNFLHKMADGEKSKYKKTVRLDEDRAKSEDKKDEKIRKKLSLSLPLCPGRSLRTRKPSKGDLILKLFKEFQFGVKG
jgi:hypothetical protein